MQAGAPAVFEGGNIKEGEAEESGDLEAGFKSAAHIVEARTKRRCRHTCASRRRAARASGRVTRSPHGSRPRPCTAAARDSRRRCRSRRPTSTRSASMGGGFGSKFGPDAQGVICAKLAKLAAAPVKLMLDRKEEHLAGGNRPPRLRRSRPASPRTAPASRSTPRHRRRRVSAPASRSPTSTRFRTGADATRTSIRTPGRRARCGRPAIRKGAMPPSC